MRISYTAATDVGCKRSGNEDSYFVDAERRLFVVADGMGGHAAGEVASQVAVEAIGEFVALTSGDDEITWPFGVDSSMSLNGNRLKTAVRYANDKVFQRMKESSEYEGMATTVVASLVDGSDATIAHVGDSRAYLYRGGQLSQLTNDHSWVNEQVQGGLISPDQARTHPLRNVVTRALGGRPDIDVDMLGHAAELGDALLLCSDGLTSMVPDDEIARVIAEGATVEETGRKLVEEAIARGGEDNITVVLIRFES
jgi:protein phosphatase